ncbi:MAG TPA: carbonic anhydrase family protein [Spirochaetes bacterium]|nr:carbonic anhydrase family protein [Spirochaetota bacterium]
MIVILTSVISCDKKKTSHPKDNGTHTSDKGHQNKGHTKKAHWSYEGDNGPSHWGTLAKMFTMCSKGRQQSPIDVTGATDSPSLPSLEFNYKATPLKIKNNGHTVQLDYQEGSYLKIGDQTYQLLQFHFHSPSEHTLNGKSFAMEAHLVHRNKLGQLAVVGLFIKKGAENPFIKKLWKHLPKTKGVVNEAKDLVNVLNALPKKKSYYSYSGSLTTPPCSEGVKWMILETPMELSEQQIEAFKAVFSGTARPVQPLNKRKLVLKK